MTGLQQILPASPTLHICDADAATYDFLKLAWAGQIMLKRMTSHHRRDRKQLQHGLHVTAPHSAAVI